MNLPESVRARRHRWAAADDTDALCVHSARHWTSLFWR